MKRKIDKWLLEWCFRRAQVGECDGIVLVNAGPPDENFINTIVAALTLVETTGSLPFARIQQRIKWIVKTPLFRAGGRYEHASKACLIDFDLLTSEYNHSLSVGWCASLLVHESTHGVLLGRGIPYSRKLRNRIERRCVKEDQRFVARLAESEPELASWLTRGFDEADWAPSWNATWAERLAWEWAQIVKIAMRPLAERAEPTVLSAEGSRETS